MFLSLILSWDCSRLLLWAFLKRVLGGRRLEEVEVVSVEGEWHSPVEGKVRTGVVKVAFEAE